MITGFILSIFYSFLAFFIGLLPVIAFPSEITNAISTLWGYINAWSFLFPVSTLLAALTIAFVYHGVVLAWHFAELIAHYVRGN